MNELDNNIKRFSNELQRPKNVSITNCGSGCYNSHVLTTVLHLLIFRKFCNKYKYSHISPNSPLLSLFLPISIPASVTALLIYRSTIEQLKVPARWMPRPHWRRCCKRYGHSIMATMPVERKRPPSGLASFKNRFGFYLCFYFW